MLADEINRATPRTQSALLEAMGEGQLTVDDRTMVLPVPFLVIATQNPVELEGTFPLPEAQLDRFLLRLRMGYPDESEEGEMLARFNGSNPMAELQPVADGAEIVELQNQVRGVYVDPVLSNYMVQLVQATRRHDDVELGASPRGHVGTVPVFSGPRCHPRSGVRNARRRTAPGSLHPVPPDNPEVSGPFAGAPKRRRSRRSLVSSGVPV